MIRVGGLGNVRREHQNNEGGKSSAVGIPVMKFGIRSMDMYGTAQIALLLMLTVPA